jgi:hypothetical protein
MGFYCLVYKQLSAYFVVVITIYFGNTTFFLGHMRSDVFIPIVTPFLTHLSELHFVLFTWSGNWVDGGYDQSTWYDYSWAHNHTSGIPCLPHSLICIFFRTYEKGDYLLFMPFYVSIELLWVDWLIIYSFTSRSRVFHLYGDVTIAGERLQNLGLRSALRAFEHREITCCDTGPRIFRSHPKDRPHLVTSYDLQGDVEDLF